MPDFSDTERRLIDLLKVGVKFKFDGVEYTVSQPSCKPTVVKGECKTDVYVQTSSANGDRVFKISVKQQNADFLENKMSHERAVEIFGSQADAIIMRAIESIKENFLNTPIIYFERKGRTDAKSITVPTLKSKACLKCLYFTKIISDLCRNLEYFSYLYTIN